MQKTEICTYKTVTPQDLSESQRDDICAICQEDLFINGRKVISHQINGKGPYWHPQHNKCLMNFVKASIFNPVSCPVCTKSIDTRSILSSEQITIAENKYKIKCILEHYIKAFLPETVIRWGIIFFKIKTQQDVDAFQDLVINKFFEFDTNQELCCKRIQSCVLMFIISCFNSGDDVSTTILRYNREFCPQLEQVYNYNIGRAIFANEEELGDYLRKNFQILESIPRFVSRRNLSQIKGINVSPIRAFVGSTICVLTGGIKWQGYALTVLGSLGTFKILEHPSIYNKLPNNVVALPTLILGSALLAHMVPSTRGTVISIVSGTALSLMAEFFLAQGAYNFAERIAYTSSIIKYKIEISSIVTGVFAAAGANLSRYFLS